LLIKYFAVPKGIINGIVQDWQTVFHAGANKLNDCIWTPSFSLPTVNSLLCIVNHNTLMANQDMGKMFLNFHLHSDTIKFAGIDLAPLEFSKEECNQRWMCLRHNLMGFKALPYNSVRMYLVAEEVIRGNRNNYTNVFQWSNLMLNLPGTRGYNPLRAWITKMRSDNSLASNFVCFMDDQRVTGHGSRRVREAGHAISTRESYLGLPDALRKVQGP
jgi:hypothetical protein